MFKRYKDTADIQVGDVLTMDGNTENPAYHAFTTCIVEKFSNDLSKVTLVRPHVSVHATTKQMATAYVACERFEVELGQVKRDFFVFVTGASGHTDNRRLDSLAAL